MSSSGYSHLFTVVDRSTCGPILEHGGRFETEVFGEQRFEAIQERVKDLRLINVLDEQNTVRDRRRLENSWNIQITWAEYFRLRAGIRTFMHRMVENEEEGMQLEAFMDKGKLRCSRLRKIVEGKRGKRYREHDPRFIPSLNTMWGLRVREMDRIEWNLNVWTISALAPRFKDFCFRMLHGRLYLNLALSHFSDTRPGCTFCTVRVMRELKRENIYEGTVEYNHRLGQIENETNEHLFWSCRETQRVIEVLNDMAGTENLMVNRERYLEGVMLHKKMDSIVLIMLIRTLQYGLYKCRNRRSIPL
jgi:hypothetical protein